MPGSSPRRVLVVDDFPDAADAVAMLLTFLGHHCKVARSGVEALRLAEAHVFDVAIVDIGMPDLSGYEVARALRDRYPASLFLVALTGWGTETDRSRATEAGFDQLIFKPANHEKLTSVFVLAAKKSAARE